jgi:hypothetical protein
MFNKIKKFFVSLFGPKKSTLQCLEEIVKELSQEASQKGLFDNGLKQGAELPVESLEEVFNREYPVYLSASAQNGPVCTGTTAETILGSHKEFSMAIDPLAFHQLTGVGPKTKKKKAATKKKTKKKVSKTKKKTKSSK